MKKVFVCVSALSFLFFNFVFSQTKEQQNAIYTPVLTFSDEETGKNWFANAWGGGACKVERIIDEKDEKFKTYLRVSFKEATMTLSNPKLFEKISANWKDKSVQGFYFWLRFKGEQTDKINMEYVNFSEGKTYLFSNRLPVIPGEWQKIEIPIGGFPVGRHTHPFDIKELQQIYILIFKATGILDIGEIGIIQRYTPILPFKTKELQVPFLSKKVIIDGKVDKDEWSGSANLELSLPVDEFLCDKKKPVENSKVFLGWSKEGIFIASVMEKKDVKKLKANFNVDSTEIWKDECLELYFLPAGKPRTIINMRKYAINANGKIGPHHFARDKDYKLSVKKYSDKWELEFFLPWQALDMNPEETPFLNFNVTRTTYDEEKIEERTGWTTIKWDDLYNFGFLYLIPQNKKLAKSIKSFTFGRVEAGNYIIMGESDNPIKYKLWAFSTQNLLYTKEGDLKNGDFFIPLNFQIEKMDNYYVQFIGYSGKNLANNFFEVRFTDSQLMALNRLPVNAIAVFPEPKEIKLKNEKRQIKNGATYYLTSKEISFCADTLKKEVERFYGISLKPTDNFKNADIIIDLNFKDPEIKEFFKSKNLLDKFEKIKYDGYLLLIDEDKMIVTGKEKRGVFYGTNVLLDLIKMTTGEVSSEVYVKNCIVVDWPDFKIRYWTDTFRGYYPAQKLPPSIYMEMIEKIPLKFRYNGFAISPADFYHWECAPSIRLKQGWTPEEFRELVRLLNTRYVPAVPFLYNTLGHMEWLLSYPEYSYLREDGDVYTLCTKHPDTYKVLFGFFDELIKMTGENPEYKSEYFFAGLDEVRWKTFSVPPEKRCKYCAGIPKNIIYLEHVNKLADYLRNKGYRLIMCSDMLVEEHNGLNEFKCALIRDKLPKDIVVAHWSILDYPSIPRFKELGIENWKIDTGYKVDRLNEDLIKGRGFGVYTYNWHLSITRGNTGPFYGPVAQAIYANACWNIFPDHNDSTWRKYEKIYGNFLMHNWSRKPLLNASKEIKIIDISSAVNTPVYDKDGNGWFELGEKSDLSLMDFKTKEVEGIPVKFVFKNDIPMCIKLKNKDDTAQIKVRDKLASLILLHVSHIDPKDISAFRDRKNYKDNPQGLPIVKYTIKYKDGTSTDFTANLGWNISLWKINPMSIIDIFGKYVVDARSIWEGYTKEAKEKNLPEDIVIYQYEWVNPYPERGIEDIILEKLEVEPACKFVSYALLSLSARGVR